ncbi:LacI family DNA-binding transcriptional regulator [Nonomuraea sp. NPDC005692]|uniref:LacI family DNA-binding transcriptional regulator n=1 Tax=Nonomuraea sp. NPDC005692 TaxID=3157168 RepID=UPI0033C9CDDD
MAKAARRVTSADVARAVGVSRTTVSFVLNDRPGQSIPEETRRRVLEAAQRLGYRPHAPARALAAGRSDIVLLSLRSMTQGPTVTSLVEGLATALAARRLTLVLHLGGEGTRPLPDVCAAVAASAVLGLEPFDAATTAALYEAGADVVLPAETDSLAGYQREVGRLQAEHLIAGGHRRIGYATSGLALAGPIASERLRGVREACAAAGLAPPPVLTVDLEADSAARAVARWRQEGVSAVCAYSDEVAVAVLAGLREWGLAAPGDLAVVGVEDMPTARLAGPPLTTIAFDSHALGRELADAVLAALEGRRYGLDTDGRHFRLIPRSST